MLQTHVTNGYLQENFFSNEMLGKLKVNLELAFGRIGKVRPFGVWT
jgi:hypothetical protein